MHTDYRSTAIRRFRDEQISSASRQQQLAQVDRAEHLLAELETGRSYTDRYVLGQIDAHASQTAPASRLSADDVHHDLRLLIEDISDAANVSVEAAGERVLTVEELGKLFQVSTKTINRWRQQGLVGRRFSIDGRKRTGFLQSSVERFVAGNKERIRRGSRFRHMTDDERGQIVDGARRLSAEGCGLNDVANRLSRWMDRSPGTIRGAIKQHDREHPDQAIFPGENGPLSEETKEKIYERFRKGDSVERLAKSYGRTKATIYRVISRHRYIRIMELPLEFIPNDAFPRVRNDATIVGPMPDADVKPRKARIPKDLPSYLASLYEVPLLTREQEQHLFRKFNYLKYRASRLREKLDSERPQKRLMDEIEQLYDKAVATKNQLVRANLRLVVSIAKRHVAPQENFFELVSDGNVSLIRAVEKFDYSRGFKFSTYASWAIMKNFARSIPDELKQRDRFRTSHDETFIASEERRSDWYGQELAHQQRLREVEKILKRLDEREQKIIIHRFGLDYAQEPQTLKQVGEQMGVTKERVRQIEARALGKLRAAVEEEKLDPPGPS